jgi:ATP-dependent DNA ligase
MHAARRGAVTPATFVAFDVLALAGRGLRTRRPYWARREQLLRHAHPPLALTPMTRDLAGARAWMTEHTPAGIEGGRQGHPARLLARTTGLVS